MKKLALAFMAMLLVAAAANTYVTQNLIVQQTSNLAAATASSLMLSGTHPVAQTTCTSPNGVLSATKGSVCYDAVNAKVWQNTDGATAWSSIGTTYSAGTGLLLTSTTFSANLDGGNCVVGTIATSLSATGGLGCTSIGSQGGITGGSLTTNVIPKATGATAIGNSSITDDGTAVSSTEDTGTSGMLWAGGASSNRAIYLGSSSNATIGARYNSNSVQALNINTVGYLGGTTQNRNLFVGDGKGNTVFSVTGSSKLTEFAGPVALDTHIGTTGTAPTLSSCGTSPSITGTDTAGLVTLGTTSSGVCTVTFASSYTSTPVCNITLTTSGTAQMSVSARSNSAFSVHSPTDTSGSTFSYVCIGNPN